MHTTDQVLSTAAIAKLAGVDRSTVTRWVKDGHLVPTFTGEGQHPAMYFKSSDVESFLAGRSTRS